MKTSIGIGVYKYIYPVYIYSFGERILPECHTRDVGLSNSMKLRCGVFNKVFLVNHWHDILNCSYK